MAVLLRASDASFRSSLLKECLGRGFSYPSLAATNENRRIAACEDRPGCSSEAGEPSAWRGSAPAEKTAQSCHAPRRRRLASMPKCKSLASSGDGTMEPLSGFEPLTC